MEKMQTAYIVAGYRTAVGKSKRGGFRFFRPDGRRNRTFAGSGSPSHRHAAWVPVVGCMTQVMTPDTGDLGLVQRVQRGDKSAFDLLVRYLEKFAIPWKGRV